jgi:enoyl-CoA hydratase/carnithine racemase
MATEVAAVLLEKRDGVAWLTVNRPEKRNSLNMAVATQLVAHLADCAADSNVKAIMLGAAGNTFCAGNDLAEFKQRFGNPALSQEFEESIRKMHESVRTCPKIVVAVVNGACLGGGMTLLVSCDIAIASEAAEFGLPEIKYGVWPALATGALMHTLSPKHALYMIVTGRNSSAHEAMAMGLVNKVVPSTELDVAAQELAKTLGGYDLDTLVWAKKVAYDTQHMNYAQSLQYGLYAYRSFFSTNQSFETSIGNFLQRNAQSSSP